ncbi:MAG: 1,4-alpha-glucan branching protein GlgB [Thermodesulfobacteriota bacterium]
MKAELDALAKGEHSDPHHLLGGHPYNRGDKNEMVIRAFHPDASMATLLIGGQSLDIPRIHPGGIFEVRLKGETWPFPYRFRFSFPDGNLWETEDPYRFLPTLGDIDLHLFNEGNHLKLYERLGAHLKTIEGVSGVSFSIWAPNAKRVSLLGEFNRWDGRLFPMRAMGSSGIWELFVPNLGPGILYKFEIKTQDNDLRIKTDPMAFSMENPPGACARVWDLSTYQWNDGVWIENRSRTNLRNAPMAIYECHLSSFRRVPEEGYRSMTYREITPYLIEEMKKYGFNYLELMPVAEYPFEGSWGYQVTGYYAPTSRYGTPDDFRFLVDACHQSGIGVILDWVPAHFPKDDYSLRWFDGTALYEHADPRKGEHQDWGTLIFNFGRNEVRNFLLANALFWLDQYHIDGLRVDAVASMLYLDYSRKEGEWIPNQYGGRENLEALSFLRTVNEKVYGLFPGCFTVAEESTDWGGVTLPVYLGGLGFGFKWNMGWMNDTLLYFSRDPVHRSSHHNDLTFSMLYEYTENFIMPLSHDEVVHGKGSLLSKMPGDTWKKFANLRTLLGYMYTHPGKKLLFMGTELAMDREWDHDQSLDWHLQSDPLRQGFQNYLADLGRCYLNDPALWQWDYHPEGFRWIDCQDWQQSIVSYVRRSKESWLVVALNLTPVPRLGYRIGVPEALFYREIINSNSEWYGGSNLGNAGLIRTEPTPFHDYSHSLSLTLPPLSCLILKPEMGQ